LTPANEGNFIAPRSPPLNRGKGRNDQIANLLQTSAGVSFIDTILSALRLRRESKAREHQLVSDVQTAALLLLDAIHRQKYVDGARFHEIDETKARLAAALNRLPQHTRAELPACERLTRETWQDNFRAPTWNVKDQRQAVLAEVGEALAKLG